MDVKICGITIPEQAVAIAHLGADYLGYICVESSPRFVTSQQVEIITSATQNYDINHVGVFLDAEIEYISTYSGKLNAVQLHGHESIEFCQKIRSEFAEIKLIKAFRVKNSQSIDQAILYSQYVDVLLLDAYDPKIAGGTGKTIDWEILKNFRPSCQWWLAGGLSEQNVKVAIAQLQPDGIDVSSGVEKAPGDKDINQVRNLLALAKSVINFDKSTVNYE
ncbi:phosphoribosylanthranilate isomerase [Synechococcus sp. PCC 7502]|uniref:phosphoribosylanthranilate isomerase n=1 Tax=Synechococcus sp. PCC 7502 TaxID=1173263 RepID=UPI00029FAA42|nr:phosphoribosylanthranilate isomerase [Synechococcus sp. PCC 7502]AFY74726.1 phosphoribosylanthranilate isomerase [Synechococcus sp. PCC 7502]